MPKIIIIKKALLTRNELGDDTIGFGKLVQEPKLALIWDKTITILYNRTIYIYINKQLLVALTFCISVSRWNGR